MLNVGFIGLGNIGKPMAENLAKKATDHGLSLQVYDVMPEPVADLVALGATAADSPLDIARDCDLVGICVRHDQDVEDLLYGKGGTPGMFEQARSGAIYAIHSTVTRDNIVRWAGDAGRYHMHVVDAPITGGAAVAAEGGLCVMLGTEPAIAERLKPMLDCVSTTVVAAGRPGDGTVLKLANNLMNYIAFTAASEGTALVKAAGVDVEKLYAVGEANKVLSPMAKQFVSGRDMMLEAASESDVRAIFEPFATLAEKDLDHALSLAGQLGISLPCGETARAGIFHSFLHAITPEGDRG
ncbi:NAD(P)-dependent oxidoreductase [Spongiibacter nanhainus]|uniref:NAD(P)-dependent oxidoreductase n=1 Tax=Spongiibacter nanhainus TaxID=2794344 RepID=A0A7T4QZN5_9GAMM|nr:NAD(P)-dependent oxidoreductase [Spongiibacter nanhainus]QQD17770.1 NAD(P)-dependent oxidoreductase [Spongiibacter nanhainus]